MARFTGSAQVRIKLNSAGVRQLLRSSEVMADLDARARRVAAAAGEGHEVQLWVGRNRARATVRTATFGAMRAEASRQTLTRAVDAAR
jgi:hypothetical protein